MIFHLRRIISEAYEYDIDNILETLAQEYGKSSVEQLKTEIDIDRQTIIDLFEKHNGSVYGEELFGQVDFDIIYQLNQYPDDPKQFFGETQ